MNMKCVEFNQRVYSNDRYGCKTIISAREQFNKFDWSNKNIFSIQTHRVDNTDTGLSIVVFYEEVNNE